MDDHLRTGPLAHYHLPSSIVDTQLLCVNHLCTHWEDPFPASTFLFPPTVRTFPIYVYSTCMTHLANFTDAEECARTLMQTLLASGNPLNALNLSSAMENQGCSNNSSHVSGTFRWPKSRTATARWSTQLCTTTTIVRKHFWIWAWTSESAVAIWICS